MQIIGQIRIDLGILEITNGFHLAEVVLLLLVFAIQLYQTVSTSRKISVLKKAFTIPVRLKHGRIAEEDMRRGLRSVSAVRDEDETEGEGKFRRITIIETTKKNRILDQMAGAINNYLIKNYGAVVNFSIIRDIIDREVESYDEEISHSIPTPLYLGLGATMLGIIFGLLAIPTISATDGGEETQAFVGIINPLIDGVKIAMFVSVIGLLFTTYLSSFRYRNAKIYILSQKNRLLTYLETELLPELYEAEGSGVSGLKSSLDHFSRKAEEIVVKVDETVQKTYYNIQVQLDLVRRVEQLDINKIANLNLTVFNSLERNLEALAGFSAYLDSLERIAGNLNRFAERTAGIDTVAGQIHDTLDESGRLTKFLAQHFEEMEKLGEHARTSVSVAGGLTIEALNLAESHFRKAIEKLEEEIDNRIQLLNNRVNLDESHLAEKYGQFKAEMNALTSRHLESFRQAYTQAVPSFEQLDKLQELGPIKDVIDNNARSLKEVIVENNNMLNENLSRLNQNLELMISKNNDAQVMKELLDIQKKLNSHGRKKHEERITTVTPDKSSRWRKFFQGSFRFK